jgi:hypothetical protein
MSWRAGNEAGSERRVARGDGEPRCGGRPEEVMMASGRTAWVALSVLSAIIAVADTLAAGPAAAQITPTSAQEIQVSAAQAYQAAPAVTGDVLGNFVVVW